MVALAECHVLPSFAASEPAARLQRMAPRGRAAGTAVPWYPSRAALATLFLALAGIGPRAAADPLPDCDGEPGSSAYCAPLVGCFERDGRHFVGRAIGRNAGTLAGVLSTGALCTGTWVSRIVIGVGQADLRCDDGTAARIWFTYQDGLTGTATGRGLTIRGAPVRARSGRNIRAFLGSGGCAVDPGLFCGDAEIPIG